MPSRNADPFPGLSNSTVLIIKNQNNKAMLSLARTNCFRDGRGILFAVSEKTTLTV